MQTHTNQLCESCGNRDCKTGHAIREVLFRKYSDTGQVKCFVLWAQGLTTEGTIPQYPALDGWLGFLEPFLFAAGAHMESLILRGSREMAVFRGETW